MRKRNIVESDWKFKDWLEVTQFNKDGDIIDSHQGEDLITSAGKAAVPALILKDITTVSGYDFIAIGSGATAASTGDTTLEAEADRAAATGTRVTTTVTNDTAQLVYVFSSGNPTGLQGTSTGTQAIEESGLFSELTGGVLLCRQCFSPLNIDWDGGAEFMGETIIPRIQSQHYLEGPMYLNLANGE